MTISITLSPEVEAQLWEQAKKRGQDVSLVAAELLRKILEWELEDSQEAIKGIQKGLDVFEAGRFRPFEEFAKEQRQKYNLPTQE